MSRYFTESEDVGSSGKVEVFTISKAEKEEAIFSKKRKREKAGTGLYAKNRKKDRGPDRFPGPAPVNPETLERHKKSDGVQPKRLKTKFARRMAEKREKDRINAEKLAARTEILLQDDAGYLEPDSDDEFTGRVSQTQIKRAVDAESAAKGFDLNLAQFGPYTIDYTRNGRFLLLGGRKGHVAALDWTQKRLRCEVNVQESVHDVKWLHAETMFAVAQKKWTYIYDNQGIELHCLKSLDHVLKMEFLPYHFLLATSSEYGFLSWLDVSVGKMVAQFNAHHGRLPIMCQNATNAVVCLGHSKGVVSMWTPNLREPVVRMWAHKQPLTAVAFDRSGTYLATTSMDRRMKIWDARMFKCLMDYRLPGAASNLAISDRKVVAVSVDNEVHLYRDAFTKAIDYPYLRHTTWKAVNDMHFVPFEDVMGIGHASGFSSILVPGAGEPNYDALEANPFQNKKQRREAEVKALLEKIPSELITLNPRDLAEVNLDKLQQSVDDKKAKLYLKPEKVEFEPRNKTRGRSGTVKRYHIKRTVQEEAKWKHLKEQVKEKQKDEEEREGPKRKEKPAKGLLERL